jgi:hypothetical protein
LLANPLPCLRDVRAPLSTGCVWLLTLWLILEDRVPTSQQAHDVWASLYRLGDVIGPAGVLASGAFLAFLIDALRVSVHEISIHAVAGSAPGTTRHAPAEASGPACAAGRLGCSLLADGSHEACIDFPMAKAAADVRQ